MKKLIVIFFCIFVLSCSVDQESISEISSYSYSIPENIGDGWEVDSLQNKSLPQEDLESELSDIFSQYKKLHGLLIVKGGKLVLEEYFGGFTRNAKHEVQSASKSFRSALIGIAIDKGYIKSEKEKIFNYLEDYNAYNNQGRENITIENIMTMSSGLEWNESKIPFSDVNNNLNQMYQSSDWIDYVLSQPMSDIPGTVFSYNTGASLLLTNILQRSTGIRADKFADDVLYEPMGMQLHLGNLPPLSDGMRPRDMAKFGYLFLNNGIWKGDQIIPKKWIDLSTKYHIDTYGQSLGWLKKYGYHWWMGTETIEGKDIFMYAASGNGGQVIAVFPELDLVVVFTGAFFTDAFTPFRILKDRIIPIIVRYGQ